MSGLFAVHKLNRRVVLLEKCKMMVNAIHTEIEYLLLPSTEIIDLLALRKDFQDLKFISYCNQKIKSGIDFKSAWKEAVSQYAVDFYLNKSDIEILNSFSENFGITDSYGQISNCKLFEEKIESALKDAEKKREKYSKLYGSLGLLSGLCCVIVLI